MTCLEIIARVKLVGAGKTFVQLSETNAEARTNMNSVLFVAVAAVSAVPISIVNSTQKSCWALSDLTNSYFVQHNTGVGVKSATRFR